MKKSRDVIVIAGLAFLLARCVNDKTTEITPTVKNNVSFQLDIQPIFNQECIMCHRPMMGVAPDLTNGHAYESLINREGSIMPGDSGGSELMDMLHGGGDNPMPPGTKISPMKIALIAKWIDEGAKNN